MKNIFFLTLSLLFAVMSSKAQPQDISLDGEWLFIADSTDFSAGLPTNATPVMVPHTYNVMAGLEDYTGRVWYEKRFNIPVAMKGQQLRVRFEAVYHDATVYLNGQKVGCHIGKGYTPFFFDITRYVVFGQVNTLTVEVDNSFSDYNFPYKRAFDWANDGGIYRHVSLHTSGKKSIRYAHFTPKFSLTDSTGSSHVSICLNEPHVKRATFALKVSGKKTGQVVYARQLSLKKTT